MIDIVDNVALAISGDTAEPTQSSNFDLKFAYSQMPFSNETSPVYKFGIAEGSLTGYIGSKQQDA